MKDVRRAVAPDDGTRIDTRGMEDGAAHPVDAAHAFTRERHGIGVDRRGVGGIDGEYPLPAASEAQHLPAEIVGVAGDRADAGVEPCTSPSPVRLPIRNWAHFRPLSPRYRPGVGGGTAGNNKTGVRGSSQET